MRRVLFYPLVIGMTGLAIGLLLGGLVYVLGFLPCVFGGKSCDPGVTVAGIGLFATLAGTVVGLITSLMIRRTRPNSSAGTTRANLKVATCWGVLQKIQKEPFQTALVVVVSSGF